MFAAYGRLDLIVHSIERDNDVECVCKVEQCEVLGEERRVRHTEGRRLDS